MENCTSGGSLSDLNGSSKSKHFSDCFYRLGQAIKTADFRCGSSVDNADELDLVWEDGEGIRHGFRSMRRKELGQRSQGFSVYLRFCFSFLGGMRAFLW